jgi:1,4-dihydroxy-2-naphthoate octaprenyltransferase
MSLTLAAVGAVVAALFDTSVAPFLQIGGGQLDLVIVLAVIWTVVVGFEGGLTWAFVGGMLTDLLAPRPLGSTAFVALIVVGVAAAIGLAIAAYFIVERGWIAAAFAAAGIALMFLYDAAPIPLKSVGLGELAVFLVWGPLMVGGGYAVITGHIAADAFYASIPYGLGVMSILTGKHIDQMDFDATKGNRTLPVLLGERNARMFNAATVIFMYVVIVALIVSGRLTPFAALVACALPRALRTVSVMSRPRPAAPPAGYVGWPLWYHRVCLQHNRLFGWLYILGLAAGAFTSFLQRGG